LGQSSVTFGDGRWYVAWGGRPEIVTQLQRFTIDGQVDGPATKLSGTTPSELLWRTAGAGSGELVLLGWVPPAYTKAGRTESLHRFGPALDPIGSPILLRSPGAMGFGGIDDIASDGSLVMLRASGRAEPLVREVRIDVAGDVNQKPVQRDWFISGSKSSFVGVQQIGARRFAVDFDGTGIRVTPLADDGTQGASSQVLSASFEPGNVVVWTKLIGGTWWVGGYSAHQGPTTVHLRAVDPATRTGTGEAIAITWAQGSPWSLIDANGTPMILGSIEPFAVPNRASLVPIDVGARAACRASTIVVDPYRDQHQAIRAIYFAGDKAGITLDTWAGSGPRRMFFTRLGCKHQ
jgi:hypothetical protein